MPKEIKDPDKIDEIIPRVDEVRIKRGEERVKVKFRTSKYLYTIKVTPEAANRIEEMVKDRGIEITYY